MQATGATASLAEQPDAAASVAEQALRRHDFVKVIAGIASDQPGRVRNFAYIYTLAGVHVIDVSAEPAVIRAARAGIDAALAALADQGRGRVAPLLMVSVGVDSDPHVSSPLIDLSTCATCAGCVIPELKGCVQTPVETRHGVCPTCYYCVGSCPHGAIKLAPRAGLSRAMLRLAREAGASAIELHVSAAAVDEIGTSYRLVRDALGDLPVSFSLGSEVSSHAFVEQQVEAVEELGARFAIIQSEGRPSSGRPGGGATQVLPALALAARVLGKRRRAYVQLSGGADEQTGSLVKALGLAVHGVAFGSCARLIVSDALSAPLLDEGHPALAPALTAARRLVRSVKSHAVVGL